MNRSDLSRRSFVGGAAGGPLGLAALTRQQDAQSLDERWPGFCYDARNTGRAPENTPLADPVGALDRVVSEAGVFASPAVGEERVVVGTRESELVAFDKRTLEVLWRYGADDWVDGSPVLWEGDVLAGSDDGNLYAVDLETGEESWVFDVGEPVWAPPTAGPRSVVVCGNAGRVVALRRDGSVLWDVQLSDPVSAAPAVTEDWVLVPTVEGDLHVFDESGDSLWTFDGGTDFRSAPAVEDERVYIGDMDGSVCALDVAAQSVDWQTSVDGEVYASPTVGSTYLYVGVSRPDASASGALLSLSKEQGIRQTATSLQGQVLTSPAMAGGSVVCGTTTGAVISVDAETGIQQWRYETGGRLRSSPAMTDGRVYIGDDTGGCHVLADEAAVEAFSSPTPSQTPSQTPTARAAVPTREPTLVNRLSSGREIIAGVGLLGILGYVYARRRGDDDSSGRGTTRREGGDERSENAAPSGDDSTENARGADADEGESGDDGGSATAPDGESAARTTTGDGTAETGAGDRPAARHLEQAREAESAFRDERATGSGDGAEPLSDAIMAYLRARKALDEDDDRLPEVEAKIDELRMERREAQEESERLEEFREKLGRAERMFDDGVDSLEAGQSTVARIDFRQARDLYRDVANTAREAEITNLDMSVDGQTFPDVEAVESRAEEANRRYEECL